MRNFENKMDKRKLLMVYEIYLYLVSCLFLLKKQRLVFCYGLEKKIFIFNLVDLTLNKRLLTNT